MTRKLIHRVTRSKKYVIEWKEACGKHVVQQVWNPGFDVTPGELIDGLVTEKGICKKDAGKPYDVPAFVALHSN